MTYRLRLEVHGVEAAIRALDLLHRLDVPMLELETARQANGFLVHLAFEAANAQAASHICVRVGQIVGVAAAEMVSQEPGDLGTADLTCCDLRASPGHSLPTRC